MFVVHVFAKAACLLGPRFYAALVFGCGRVAMQLISTIRMSLW
jgi:hypothetical protein